MKRCLLTFASCLLLVLQAMPAMALADVSRSFTASDSGIVSGSLVATKSGGADNAVLANTDNGQRLVGVAVSVDKSLLAIDSSTGKVQVAISGTADVLVSTINGEIHAGDQVVVSPISGVGMEASGSLRTIGIAQASFSASTSGVQKRQITDKAGHTSQVSIGAIPVTIAIGYASAGSSQSGLLGGLQMTATAIVGHQVSTLQTILSFLVVIIALSALIGLVYGAIHGSLVSIGRNPLARESIYRSLIQVVIMAALIAAIALMILYFTLR